jgi:hypothetical protein
MGPARFPTGVNTATALSKGITCVGIWEHTGAWNVLRELGFRLCTVDPAGGDQLWNTQAWQDHINKPKSLVALGILTPSEARMMLVEK